jgi:hypothetical protein
MSFRTIARLVLGGALAVETGLSLHRFETRRRTYEAAARRAVEVGRPLIVVGDPDAGAHTRLVRAYGCGDLCIDLHGCPQCRVMQTADLTEGPVLGVADDSAVVYISCVLEYVADPAAALRELHRMAGSPENLFVVFVHPNSLTAALYPGARWTGVIDGASMRFAPVTTARKAVTVTAIAGLVALGLGRARGA